MKRNRLLFSTVAVVVSFAALSAGAQAPPPITDNPGVPGLIAALQAQIARLQATIAALNARPAAPVPATGQTHSFVPFDDAALQKGVPLPSPRFTDNGDGTVADNLTGLVWLKKVDCFGPLAWPDAIAAAHALVGDGTKCGLTDKSTLGQWRLPNIREFQSLIHYGFNNPSVSNAAGTGVSTEGDPYIGLVNASVTFNFWTSTSVSPALEIGNLQWTCGMDIGLCYDRAFYNKYLAWPVRDASE